MPHLSDVRSSKSSFQLTTVLSFVKQIAASTVAKDMKPGVSAWDSIGESITQLVEEGGKLLPLAMEPENVLKGKWLRSLCCPNTHCTIFIVSGMAPWVVRVDEIKANTAINVEAEKKVIQLNDEMQGLVRSLRTKEQNIQESVVKIELMERRMEAAKKQADTIVDLEGELSKARKQERAYEEAMEQLQADLDTLEQDNAKLKALTVGHERQGKLSQSSVPWLGSLTVAVSGAQPVETENIPFEGSLETSHLLDQVRFNETPTNNFLIIRRPDRRTSRNGSVPSY